MSAGPLVAGLSLAQMGMSLLAQKQASKSADAEAKYQKRLLERKEDSERNAMRENSRRMLADRQRQLAELRAEQVGRGFATTGTQLAVFGDVQNRIDERIDEATNQSLDQISQFREQRKMINFQTKQRHSAERMQMFSTVIQGATSASMNGAQANKTFGNQPFSLF